MNRPQGLLRTELLKNSAETVANENDLVNITKGLAAKQINSMDTIYITITMGVGTYSIGME